ncbi:hypothetical protein AOLI_G00166810 [Acnodon oligacanthus]
MLPVSANCHLPFMVIPNTFSDAEVWTEVVFVFQTHSVELSSHSGRRDRNTCGFLDFEFDAA